MSAQSHQDHPSKTVRTTVRKLIKKMKPAKEEPMPGELDSTEVQLARFFAKPAVASSPSMRRDQPSPTSLSSLSPATSLASSSSSSPSSRTKIEDLARRRAPYTSNTASDAFGTAQYRD